jgi:uncharacterized membrane protein
VAAWHCACVSGRGSIELMASLEEQLDNWLAAGLIDARVAEGIRAFERRKPQRGQAGPGFLEAIVYLGAAVAAVGVVILVSASWEDLREWARVAVVGVPGLLALVAGTALRRYEQPGLVRGGQLVWLAGTALCAGSAAVIGANADWKPEDCALAAGIVGSTIALALWAIGPSHPQVVGMAAGLAVLSIGLGGRTDEFDARITGGTIAAFGVLGLAMSERGLLVPAISGRTVSALGAALGAWFAGAASGGGWTESLIFIAGAGLIALSVWRAVFLYMIVGVAGIFLGLVSTISLHVREPSAAAAALIAIGAVLIASVLLLARLRPWQRTSTA